MDHFSSNNSFAVVPNWFNEKKQFTVRDKKKALNQADLTKVDNIVDWLKQHVASQAIIKIDSRQILPGDILAAYITDGVDNRQHIHDAIARGAAAILFQDDNQETLYEDFVDQSTLPILANHYPHTNALHAKPIPRLNIASLGKFIGYIASEWYRQPSQSLLTVGVTGTNGKTSCSYWIAYTLNQLGIDTGLIGTLGVGKPKQLKMTGFTTPDAPQLQLHLSNLKKQNNQAVIMEVSSHALQQGRTNGTQFDIAVFTNLTQDHLDYHCSFNAYRAAKSKLFAWPSLQTLVLNCDDLMGRSLLLQYAGKVQIIAYSIGQLTEEIFATAATPIKKLFASEIFSHASGTSITIDGDWGNTTFHAPTYGEFNVSNLLSVMATLLAAEQSLDSIIRIMPSLPPVPGRMEVVAESESANSPLVIVDYAHTPDALLKCLLATRPIASAKGGRLIVVFGCGGNRDTTKRSQMGAIAAHDADLVILTSDNPRHEKPAAIIEDIQLGIPEHQQTKIKIIEDRANAILQTIRIFAQSNDVILIAGKGHEATQEIAGKQYEFCDRNHARLALASRLTYRGESQ